MLIIKTWDYLHQLTPSSPIIPEEPIQAMSVALWQNRLCYRHTFTFRAFGRHIYPKRLTKSIFVERETEQVSRIARLPAY